MESESPIQNQEYSWVQGAISRLRSIPLEMLAEPLTRFDPDESGRS
jgi:hypothetical protein